MLHYAPGSLRSGWRKRCLNWAEINLFDSLMASVALLCSTFAWLIAIVVWLIGRSFVGGYIGIPLALAALLLSFNAMCDPQTRKAVALLSMSLAALYCLLILGLMILWQFAMA